MTYEELMAELDSAYEKFLGNPMRATTEDLKKEASRKPNRLHVKADVTIEVDEGAGRAFNSLFGDLF